MAVALAAWSGSLWLAIALGVGSMVLFGFALERVMLRRLIGRPVIAVVMATIGLASILRGVGPTFFGAGTKNLPLPISDEPFVIGPLFISPIQLVGAGVSLLFLAHILRDWSGDPVAQIHQLAEITSFWIAGMSRFMIWHSLDAKSST